MCEVVYVILTLYCSSGAFSIIVTVKLGSSTSLAGAILPRPQICIVVVVNT